MAAQANRSALDGSRGAPAKLAPLSCLWYAEKDMPGASAAVRCDRHIRSRQCADIETDICIKVSRLKSLTGVFASGETHHPRKAGTPPH